MRLVPLTPDYPLVAFDCGDDDLNKFLLDDAKPAQELRIANTFIVEADDGRIAAYFCLLNDKISKSEVIGSRWKKIRSSFPRDKQFSSYPSVKIGRFAVSLDFRGENLGTDTMKKLKLLLASEQPRSAYDEEGRGRAHPTDVLRHDGDCRITQITKTNSPHHVYATAHLHTRF